MAARDILNLGTPMAEGIIRLLYTIALILIGLGTLFGIGRGVMILTHTPMQRPAITSSATPPSGATAEQQGNPAPQAQGEQNTRPDFRGMRGDYRGWHRWGHHRGPFGMMPRSPWFGLVVIVGALLRGLIALLIVRVMAELVLAVLSLPKRAAA
ncbi:MAG TPA: hypothetical protein VN723_11325 [Rhizomicrobium sp.]|nr:hypothetical protein [Rhizomicrobium sp.]